MKRSKFLTGIALGVPALCALSAAQAFKPTKESINLIQKAKNAMLAMQRASWEQGTAMHGLMELNDNDLLILMAHEAVVRQNKDGRLGMLSSGNNVTDPVSNGIGVLQAFKLTGDRKFKEAADLLYAYCKNAAPKNKNGTLFHLNNSQQLWSDSIFMAPPFLSYMGDWDESVKQIEGYREFLWNKDRKLFYHQWDDTKKDFKRKEFWGGGNGWAAASLALIIDIFPKDRDAYIKLVSYLKDLLDGCIALIRPDGLFHDVMDKPDTFVETNLSQMLAFSIFKSVNSGWLEKSYLEAANKMRKAALRKIDKYGFVQDACGSPSFDKPGTSTEAQAFFLMMEGAYMKLYR